VQQTSQHKHATATTLRTIKTWSQHAILYDVWRLWDGLDHSLQSWEPTWRAVAHFPQCSECKSGVEADSLSTC